MLYKAKEFYYSSVIQDNAHNTRLLFRAIDKVLQRKTEKHHYPSADNDQHLANAFAHFFSTKIERIREELVLKSESMGAPGRCATCYLTDFNETWPV